MQKPSRHMHIQKSPVSDQVVNQLSVERIVTGKQIVTSGMTSTFCCSFFYLKKKKRKQENTSCEKHSN